MASQGSCFCLDAISFGFNIFIHSLLFLFISRLILFIICLYLRAWQSNLQSGSSRQMEKWPFSNPSFHQLSPLPSFPNSNETWLTARCISSCHSNPPILLTSAFSLQRTLALCHNISLPPSPLARCCNDRERDGARRIWKPESTWGSRRAFLLTCHPPIPIPSLPLSPHSPPTLAFLHPPHPWQWFTNSYGAPISSILAYQGLQDCMHSNLQYRHIILTLPHIHSLPLSSPRSLPLSLFISASTRLSLFLSFSCCSKLLLCPIAIQWVSFHCQNPRQPAL